MAGPKTVYSLRFSIIAVIVFFNLITFYSSDAAEVPDSETPEFAEVKGIRQWSSKGYTRVVVDLSGPVEFSNKRISNPDRLYFDLKKCKISNEINTMLPIGDGILKTVRAGQFDPDTVRLVLDLEEIKDFKTFAFDDPAKLIIDVYGHKSKAKQGSGSSPGILSIVIDPGHGGHDPGAVGPKGLYEKKVVLDIALKIKKALSKNKNLNVYMTRSKDVYLPLDERTAFANSKHADIFISIHANASPQKIARGIETYLLSWTNEEEALRIAARENYVSMKSMKAHVNKFKSELDIMLGDLARQNKRDESLELAKYIQRSITSLLSEKYNYIHDLGVKSAPFFVLFGAKMPSVLAEVSFISNPVEERLLKKEAYRENIAKAIAKGINTYIAAGPGEQKIASHQRPNGSVRVR